MSGESHVMCPVHVNRHATFKCKQCGRPGCNLCVVASPMGRFCSEPCRDKFLAFAKKAEELAEPEIKRPKLLWLRGMVQRTLAILAVILGLVIAGTAFYIPGISQVAYWIRTFLGI